MRRIELRHVVTSVIVDKINVDDVIVFEPKNNAPITGYGHAPKATQVPGQRMQPQARKVHVARNPRHIQVTKNTSDPISMRRMKARGVEALVQQSHSPMPETPDHALK
jgi:hypothetical protein